MSGEKVLVAVAWPYANGPIHLGHLAGSLLPPDIFARYHRMKGNRVLMVSGSDMHGTPITVTAEKEGVGPEVVAERYHQMNKKAIEDLGISFSLYHKTHSETHFEVVHGLFLKLLEKGHIYKETMRAPFCPKCDRFLPDRYVEGECPHCGSEGARGDQCDECGKTLDPEELIGARCKFCGSAPETRETEHFFLRLSAFEEQLSRYVEGHPHWRDNTKNFTMNWLRSGLKDRAITRDMTWGIPIPLDGYEGKCIYVWFEAVTGYLSTSVEWARRSGDPEAWREFWQDPGCRHYYFLGKDNIPFHTIIWPAMLMGHGGMNLPYDVPANEFLRLGGEQFSKSRGVSIDVPDVLERFSPDQIRYYLSVNMPENRDADFTWEDFQRRNNNELVATLGNFVHRVLTFTHKNYGSVPEYVEAKAGSEDAQAIAKIEETFKGVDRSLSLCSFKEAIGQVMALAHYSNQFFDAKAPWASIKTDKERCGTDLHMCVRLVKALAYLTQPFLPFSAQRAWEYIGGQGRLEERSWEEGYAPLAAGTPLVQPKPLFSKVELEAEEPKPDQEEAPSEPGMEALDLRVARIISVEDHPKADKLYVLRIDLGDEERQLVAGLKPYYPKKEMEGALVIVVTNLAPAKLRGVESNGMLLAADDGKGTVALLHPGVDVRPGTLVKGCTKGAAMLTFKDFQGYKIQTGEDKTVVNAASGEQLMLDDGTQLVVRRDLPPGSGVH